MIRLLQINCIVGQSCCSCPLRWWWQWYFFQWNKWRCTWWNYSWIRTFGQVSTLVTSGATRVSLGPLRLSPVGCFPAPITWKIALHVFKHVIGPSTFQLSSNHLKTSESAFYIILHHLSLGLGWGQIFFAS